MLLILLLVLGIIIIQDFRERAISWWTIPILFGASFYHASIDFLFDYWMFGLNCFLIFFQCLILTLYFSIKHQRWINITQQYLGIGDVLFLLAITPLFAPFLFCLFIVLSLVVTLLLHFSIQKIKKENKNIPFAGFLSIYLFLLILVSQYSDFSLYNDLQVVKYLYG